MNCAARALPASSAWARVKISSNWSKISSGMTVLPFASFRISSRWCRNSQSDSPLAAVPGCVQVPEDSVARKIAALICSVGGGESGE